MRVRQYVNLDTCSTRKVSTLRSVSHPEISAYETISLHELIEHQRIELCIGYLVK